MRKCRSKSGYNCDFTAVLPLPRRDRDHALLVVNHEYTNEELMFHGWRAQGGAAGATAEQIRIAMAAHGLSVVEIERVGETGQWRRSSRRVLNRRITANTPMQLTGPAAGCALVRTSADPEGRTVLGTINNCAGGTTPWGTTLHGEENFNGYFRASEATPDSQKDSYGNDAYARYTIGSKPTDPFYRNWELVDRRFATSAEPNEPNRFGWIVELDPYDPDAMPKKRTALGRFKHEGANIRLAKDGRVVAYSGDDERFEYIYKFVSHKTFRRDDTREARRHNMTLLDEGDLYVGQFTGDSPAAEIDGSGRLPSDGAFDGTGRWLPLVKGGRSMVPGYTVEEVLVWTRLAADALGRAADGTPAPQNGPTKMDRPEDIEANLRTGKVYAALTNNSRRTTVDEANPRPANKHGHVLEISEDGNDAAAETFTWQLFIVAGDPSAPDTYFGGYDKSQVSPISCPDNVAFDRSGNLWISTDGNQLGSNDGLFAVATEGPHRGHLKQFATVPIGAECSGPFLTRDQRTAIMSVQHPGESDEASTENRISTFPYGGQPRPTVVTIWRSAPGDDRIGT
ncbi:MAG: PhoX family phosphatase [Actinomycetota bacterium]|nr:PhoX family phosphatase [Actinomycetota bacterium]